MRFWLDLTCLHCGKELKPDGASRVVPIEAVVHLTCTSCKAGATVKVLYTNGRGSAPTPITPVVMA